MFSSRGALVLPAPGGGQQPEDHCEESAALFSRYLPPPSAGSCPRGNVSLPVLGPVFCPVLTSTDLGAHPFLSAPVPLISASPVAQSPPPGTSLPSGPPSSCLAPFPPSLGPHTRPVQLASSPLLSTPHRHLCPLALLPLKKVRLLIAEHQRDQPDAEAP